MERYTIGQRCENLILDFLVLLLRANRAKDFNRRRILAEASDILDTLKILTRAAKDIKALPENKYLELQTTIHEIGRMLGGWIKSLNS